MIPLPQRFFELPFAHRGFHGLAGPENSWASFQAAIDAGYGIELDVQLSADDQAVVFHDYELDRLTSKTGLVRDLPAAALRSTKLTNGTDGIDALGPVLDRIGGRVPVLIELKDQSRVLGPSDGVLEAAVAKACQNHTDLAVMSFNPHMVAELARLMPEVPRGITTAPFLPKYWGHVPEATRARLREIPDAARVGASFVSHDARDLDRPRLRELKSEGLAVFCWTIRSEEAEKAARTIADNITFEGYNATTPLAP